MSANVALSDTFDQWRVKTNELLAMTQTGGMSNFVKLTDTTNSTSNTTGSIITTGGVGVSKSMVIGENLNVHGDIHANGTISADGNLTLGSDDTDSVDFNADIASHFIPNIDSTYNLGNTTLYWANAFINTVDLQQEAAAGKPGLKVTGVDTDAKLVEILGSQTTNDILYVNATALTTGSAFVINQDQADTTTRTLARIIQNHTGATGTTGISIQSDAGRGLFIDTNLADGDYALEIDAEQTTTNTAKIAAASTTGTILDVQAEALTTGRGINYYDDSLTTGSALYIDSASAQTDTRSLATIINNNALATGATTLTLQADAGRGLFIDTNLTTGSAGYALEIDAEHTTSNTAKIASAATTGTILDIQAEALTDGRSINIYDNSMTEGSALYIDSNSASTSTRNIASIIQNHSSASGSTTLYLQQDHATADALLVKGAVTVGVDNTGHDVKYFGATSGAYMLWDESEDDLTLVGAARAVVPDGQLVLGSTAITSTATELNVMDAGATVTTPTVASGDAFVMDDADAGMAQVDIDNVDTYLAQTTKTLSNKTFVAPALGTPASGVMTNMTGAVEASLVDNAVTLAKMAGLARGKLIYGNASGDPTALAVGTADQVLTHDGTDLAWADAAGGVDPAAETTFTAQQYFNDQSLTSGTSIAWNANTAQVAYLSLAHNGTMASATNHKAGGVYIMRVTQASSPKTLAWSTGYKWPANTAPVMTSTASAVDIFTFTSDGTYMYGSYSGSQNYT